MVAPLIPIVAGIAGRIAAKKVAQEAAKKTAKAAAAKTAQIAKNSVKVKPAAKQKPNPPDMAKISDKYQSRSYRTLDDPALTRKEKIEIKKLVSNRPSTKPSAFGSVNGRVKINSNPVRANRTRSGKKAK